jgi:uncharacterized OsmC-like protein
MITISAHVKNSEGDHQVIMTTNGQGQSIDIPPKPSGFGSSVNGGELLFLALATCYCNDLYREAAKRHITVRNVQVECHGSFGDAPGSVAENITYKAIVEAEASEDDILDLMRYTDTVAEIQNTLRRGMKVTLGGIEAISI